jgi:hypothetical protein
MLTRSALAALASTVGPFVVGALLVACNRKSPVKGGPQNSPGDGSSLAEAAVQSDGADLDSGATTRGCDFSKSSGVTSLVDVCSMAGAIVGGASSCCPAPGANWDTSMNTLPVQPGDSDIVPCPLEEANPPGWKLRIDKILTVRLHQNTTDHFDSAIVATRLDGAQQCSVKLSWELRSESVVLPIGTTVQFAYKYTVRNPETDASISAALRDSAGSLLIGYVADMRPEVWDVDVLPELTLAVSPVCLRQADTTALRVSVSTGTDSCTADDWTARCCTIAKTSYQMEVPSALRYSTHSPSDKVRMIIAKSGVLVPAH